MKKSKVLNISSSTALSYTAFLPVLCYVFAYARTFDEAHAVPFREDNVVDIRKDVQYENFIPTASGITLDLYMSMALSGINCDDLLPLVEMLKNRDSLTERKHYVN